MNHAFKAFTDASTRMPRIASARHRRVIAGMVAARWSMLAIASFVVFSLCAASVRPALAEGATRGFHAYLRGDYARAVRELAPAAMRGDPRAQAQLGFMYENGFGVPQNYDAAVDLYHSAAAQGDAFGQSRLGLSYDKGHGVSANLILSYKWLNLAAAAAPGRQGDYYRRLRDAVASKMTKAQIFEGQRLALLWGPGGW
jgi:hypothetical protein